MKDHGLERSTPSEAGFTLVEILVVVLIIGILAAIAIPSFLSQRTKATDSSAKELARTAETTAETYASDHGGNYQGMTAAELESDEKTIFVGCPTSSNACLKAVTPEGTGSEGYTVTTEATDGHTFSIKRSASGTTERTCTPTGKTGSEGGGCLGGSW
jgi:type IV pilus assembly protein PilA